MPQPSCDVRAIRASAFLRLSASLWRRRRSSVLALGSGRGPLGAGGGFATAAFCRCHLASCSRNSGDSCHSRLTISFSLMGAPFPRQPCGRLQTAATRCCQRGNNRSADDRSSCGALGCLTSWGRSYLAFRDSSSLRTHFPPAHSIRRIYVSMAHTSTSTKTMRQSSRRS